MKKVALILMIAIIATLTTSCWSRREIDNLGFVMGMGISKTEDGNYKIVIQVANPNAIVADYSQDVDLYNMMSAEGVSIFDAIRNLSMKTVRRLYFAHIKVLLIDEALAKEGIVEILDFIIRDMEVRLEIKVLISKFPPEEILDIPTVAKQIPAVVLSQTADIYGANSKVYIADMKETVESVNNPAINYVTSLVERIEENWQHDKNRYKISNIAVFDNDKLKGYLEHEEGIGYNLITNNYKTGVIIFYHPDANGNITIEVLGSSTKVTPYYQDGKVAFDIEVKVEGNLAEVTPRSQAQYVLDIKELEKYLNNRIKAIIEQTISRAQDHFEIDIFNLSKIFYRKYPKEFRALQNNWNQVFSDVDIAVKVDSRIKHTSLNTNRGR